MVEAGLTPTASPSPKPQGKKGKDESEQLEAGEPEKSSSDFTGGGGSLDKQFSADGLKDLMAICGDAKREKDSSDAADQTPKQSQSSDSEILDSPQFDMADSMSSPTQEFASANGAGMEGLGMGGGASAGMAANPATMSMAAEAAPAMMMAGS